jgi:hypothetical protein
MDKLKLDEVQKYFDPSTNYPLQLTFEHFEETFSEVLVNLDKVPLLKNTQDNKIYFPDKTKFLIKHFVEQAIENDHPQISLKPKPKNVRYPFAEDLNFKYSHIDYEYIPGLVRPWDEGFLTPLFFNLTVLNKYCQSPEYKVDLFATTYGTIYKGNEWYISFGINQNKKLIMWLGDVDELPDNEKYYLRSENIDSDHDIHSEFYNAQIEVQFAELSPLAKSFSQRKVLNELVQETYQTDLFMLHGEISRTLENLDRPIFWEDRHVSPFVESLNRIFVESINTKGLKNYLKQNHPEIDISGLKGMKLFQKWLEICLQTMEYETLMLPFFVLYDFRVLSSHLIDDDKRNDMKQSICDRLEIVNLENNNEEIIDILIRKIVYSYNSIIEIIKR